MESVIIVAPRPYDAELKARLECVGTTTEMPDGVVLHGPSSRVYVVHDEFVRGELEDDELSYIMSKIANPVFYAVNFSDSALCRTVLTAIADDPALLIDDDHGCIMPAPEFIRLIDGDPDWYRRWNRTR